MNLQHTFYKFPFRFDAERLLHEVGAIPENCWRFHHENFKGNSALHLISTNGGVNDDFEAPMRPTEYLERCPYIMQVLSTFKTLHGRARLMRLEPGHGVPPHFDLQHYWRTHTRVHIPVFTHPEIRFHCADQDVHMAAGEAWTFDNWRVHKVVNETPVRRIHLTFDTYGSTEFWRLAKPLSKEEPPSFIPYREGVRPELSYEYFVDNPVMAPGEMELELSRLAGDAAAFPGNDPATMGKLMSIVAALRNEWRILWYSVGPTKEGIPQFVRLMLDALDATSSIPESVKMASNGRPLMQALPSTLSSLVKPYAAAGIEIPPSKRATANSAPGPRFEKPVFVVSAPRSGSTLLLETMAANDALWTLGGEGHGHVERIAALDPHNRNFESNRLLAADASPAVVTQLKINYVASLCDAAGALWRDGARPDAVRFLEKTPKNAIRIPFLKAAFPDAKFIFLHREARPNISAIMEAWRSGRFVTYPDLPGWSALPWSLLLIPGWRELNGLPLGQIATRQWRDTNEIILSDLAALPAQDWCSVGYEEFVANPGATLRRLCAFADVPFGERARAATQGPLKPSRYTLSTPDPDKWRKNEPAMAPFLDLVEATRKKLTNLEMA